MLTDLVALFINSLCFFRLVLLFFSFPSLPFHLFSFSVYGSIVLESTGLVVNILFLALYSVMLLEVLIAGTIS